jgi:hypothetical protein
MQTMANLHRQGCQAMVFAYRSRSGIDVRRCGTATAITHPTLMRGVILRNHTQGWHMWGVLVSGQSVEGHVSRLRVLVALC